MEQEVLDLKQVAALLGTSEAAIRSHIQRRSTGAIPPYFRRGRRLAWRRSTVDKWLAEKEATPTPAPAPKHKRRGAPTKAERLGFNKAG